MPAQGLPRRVVFLLTIVEHDPRRITIHPEGQTVKVRFLEDYLQRGMFVRVAQVSFAITIRYKCHFGEMKDALVRNTICFCLTPCTHLQVATD